MKKKIVIILSIVVVVIVIGIAGYLKIKDLKTAPILIFESGDITYEISAKFTITTNKETTLKASDFVLYFNNDNISPEYGRNLTIATLQETRTESYKLKSGLYTLTVYFDNPSSPYSTSENLYITQINYKHIDLKIFKSEEECNYYFGSL